MQGWWHNGDRMVVFYNPEIRGGVALPDKLYDLVDLALKNVQVIQGKTFEEGAKEDGR